MDYDKLVLEVTTDGRITPDDAMKHAAAILAPSGCRRRGVAG